MRNMLPEFNKNQVNEVCLVIKDIAFPDARHLPIKVKDDHDIDALFDELQKVLARHGFELDAYSLKEPMVQRLIEKQRTIHAPSYNRGIIDAHLVQYREHPTDEVTQRMILALKKQ